MSDAVLRGRMTAEADGNVVVFLIGMRINRFRAVRAWLPVFRAMPRMLRELAAEPAHGLLAHRLLLSGPREFAVLQYWESADKLLSYASAGDAEHRPAWAAFNRRARAADGAVGVWHETYVVPAGSREAIYIDMPRYGLAAAYPAVPVKSGRDRAAQRLGAGAEA